MGLGIVRSLLAAVLICHALAALSPSAARAEELVVTVGQYFHPQATNQQRARLQTIVKNQEMSAMLNKGLFQEHACVVGKFVSTVNGQPGDATEAIVVRIEKAKRDGEFDKNAVTIIRNVIREYFLKCQEEGHVTPGAGKP